jgi:hypothetical protein
LVPSPFSLRPLFMAMSSSSIENWWRGITPLAERSQVTTHIRCVLGRPDGRRRIMMIATNNIHPKSWHSHRWQVGEILSIESPFMSRVTHNTTQAGQLREKVSPWESLTAHMARLFPLTGLLWPVRSPY